MQHIKGNYMLIILFLALFGILNAEEQVKVNLKASVENDTFQLCASIINNSSETIYVPLSELYLHGGYNWPHFGAPFPFYLFNTILFYKEEYEWANIVDVVHDYQNIKLPILGRIESMETFKIIVKFPFLDDSLREYNNDYTISYYIPYSNEKLLFQVEHVLGCTPSYDAIENSFETVLNKNKGRFEFKYSDECKAPKGMERVMRIAFINYLEAKTTIKKEELKRNE